MYPCGIAGLCGYSGGLLPECKMLTNERFPFLLQRNRGERHAGPAIPVPGIPFIALFPVEVGMKPVIRTGTLGRLRDLMRRLPVFFSVVPQCLQNIGETGGRFGLRERPGKFFKCHILFRV